MLLPVRSVRRRPRRCGYFAETIAHAGSVRSQNWHALPLTDRYTLQGKRMHLALNRELGSGRLSIGWAEGHSLRRLRYLAPWAASVLLDNVRGLIRSRAERTRRGVSPLLVRRATRAAQVSSTAEFPSFEASPSRRLRTDGSSSCFTGPSARSRSTAWRRTRLRPLRRQCFTWSTTS
jgi:hypothetical protein